MNSKQRFQQDNAQREAHLEYVRSDAFRSARDATLLFMPDVLPPNLDMGTAAAYAFKMEGARIALEQFERLSDASRPAGVRVDDNLPEDQPPIRTQPAKKK